MAEQRQRGSSTAVKINRSPFAGAGRPQATARRSGAVGKNLSNPNDPVNKEDAALDQIKTRSRPLSSISIFLTRFLYANWYCFAENAMLACGERHSDQVAPPNNR